MNREIKITLVVLLGLVGVIVFLEINQSDDVLPEVEPIDQLEVIEETPEVVPVPAPVPIEVEGDESGAAGGNRIDQSNLEGLPEELPEIEPEEEAVVEVESVEEGGRGLQAPEDSEVLKIASQIPSTYLVKKGDTLSQIAEKVLGSVQFVPALLESNPELQPHQLYVGVELEMPSRDVLQAIVDKAETLQSDETGPGFYRIEKGDSIYRISKKVFGTTKRVSEILEMNPNIDPRQLKIGQIIRLPLEK